MSANARKIASPVASSFFAPVELPADYIARFQNAPNAEHFAIGDRYDLLLGNGTIATVKLTTLIGCETDEEVGNDSFIGALGTVEKDDALVFTKDYYAVRRHQELKSSATKPKTTAEYLKYAHLDDAPVRIDIQTQIADLLNKRMRTEATDSERRLAATVPPSFKVQAFRVADGSPRYYVRAEWRSGKEPKNVAPFALAVWTSPRPALHVLAAQMRTSDYDFEGGLPNLLNVIDLGEGKTGIIVHMQGPDTTTLQLSEYRDGADLKGMHLIQSITWAE
jgi:hypothetical protein